MEPLGGIPHLFNVYAPGGCSIFYVLNYHRACPASPACPVVSISQSS